MPRTPAAAYAWARDEARAHRIRRDWAGMCEAAVNWAFDYAAFPTALAAGNASGLLRGDYANAPVGANIYWSGVWVDGVECGHIATVFAQDADPYVFMASSAVTDNWGGNLGTIRLSDYQRKFGHKLRGWSLNHGSQQPDMSGIISSGIISVKEAIMANGGALIRNNTPGYKFKGKDTFGSIALVGTGYVNPQSSMDVVRALVPVYGPVIELTGDQYHTVIRESQINHAGKPGIV